MCTQSLQLCPILCDPLNRSPPGSSVHGNPQARILEWVAMPSSRGSSQPRDWTCVSYISCLGSWVLYHEHHFVQVPESICSCTSPTGRSVLVSSNKNHTTLLPRSICCSSLPINFWCWNIRHLRTYLQHVFPLHFLPFTSCQARSKSKHLTVLQICVFQNCIPYIYYSSPFRKAL